MYGETQGRAVGKVCAESESQDTGAVAAMGAAGELSLTTHPGRGDGHTASAPMLLREMSDAQQVPFRGNSLVQPKKENGGTRKWDRLGQTPHSGVAQDRESPVALRKKHP